MAEYPTPEQNSAVYLYESPDVEFQSIYEFLVNILSGYTGQISLGHAAFLAIGAYSSTLLTLKWGIPFWISLPLGGLITALFGVLIAIPCLRLRDFTWPLPPLLLPSAWNM
jgi:branched-chain amino acid transport system permease protein